MADQFKHLSLFCTKYTESRELLWLFLMHEDAYIDNHVLLGYILGKLTGELT
jgi:hypothetical protein